MYIRTYVYMHVCMYVCKYVCTYVRMHTCMYVRTYLYRYIHLHVDLCCIQIHPRCVCEINESRNYQIVNRFQKKISQFFAQTSISR